jgi:hypothetical protein
MYTVRAASVSDLSNIYAFQNTKYRERVLVQPLPPYEEYLAEITKKLEDGQQDFFLLEKNDKLEGFVDFVKSDSSWHPTFWSRWLNTLVYVCCEAAFRIRQWSQINWYVRQNNKRMHQICERCEFRKTGEGEFWNISEGFQFVAIGSVTYFELTAEEYLQRQVWIREQSLPVQFVNQFQTT